MSSNGDTAGDRLMSGAGGPATWAVAVAATFTAEPVGPTLRFWLGALGLGGGVTFAPYNQVLQQLLDPSSELGRNAGGVNAVLVRFEDWSRFLEDRSDEAGVLARGVDDLAGALRAYASRSPAPLVLAVCPPSPAVSADPARAALHARAKARLAEAVAGLDAVHRLDLPGGAYDPRGDRVGHMPYTPEGYTALATALARRAHALKVPRPKVLALDCDNTLWRGVVGEDGPLGVTFPPGLRAVHEFASRQQAAGVLVCLVSKNAEEDVRAVFDARAGEMGLRLDQVVAVRANWLPKPENLRSLAVELNLGLDSFAFLDDNPVECAEARAACPEVLTLQLPAAEVPAFLGHLWPFDVAAVTDEDRRRTEMYRQNADRDRFEREAGGLDAFLAGLALKVEIGPPSDDQVPRVAQLTQRTNQFNLTTVRRDEVQVRRLAGEGLECLRVEVSDRFGDYGLVGVMVLADRPDAVEVETMLLSCRVLGRGVEHAMLAHAGRLARERGKARVDVRFVPTPKNRPAADFLRPLGGADREDLGGGAAVFRVPAVAAADLRYAPGGDAPARPEPLPDRTAGAKAQSPGVDRSALYQRIATSLRDPGAVLRAVEQASMTARPDLDTPYVAPRTDLERGLAQLWERLLGVDRVGVFDGFAALGGTSLQAARLFVEVEERYGPRLPMATILDAPTVDRLAARVSGGAREVLRVLRPGEPGGPALFLVHDGDGETLLYLNLARRMPPGVAVYGLEPLGTDRFPMLHTRVPEMAAHYLSEISRVRPEGPYALGGMCAGGVIAFEMALQLEARGESVGLLALLDPAAPLAAPRVGLTNGRRWSRFSQALRAGGEGPALRRLAGRAVGAARKVKNLAAYELTARARKSVARARFLVLRRAGDRGRPAPWYAAGLSVRRVYEGAERGYVPAGVLASPAVLFRATSGQGADEPFASLFADPMLGWGRWVDGGPDVCDVPGGHSSMLQEPNVAVIAERLKAALGVPALAEPEPATWTS
jgi:FkbH-like protein